MMSHQVSNHADPARNKYHTLTLAEAKKLNRSLATGSLNMAHSSQTPNQNPYLYSTIRRAPIRTASVLHKPRAPPIVVTDLDNIIDQLDAASDIDRGSPKSLRSVSKLSLSASTYKVFQSPIANFRKFLRNMPRPFSTNNDLETKMESHFDINTAKHSAPNHYTNRSSQSQDRSLGELSIGDSISQISFNKSQSPPVCPPPPGHLKSMCYMESAINYSNYDEFTRSRNQRMNQRHHSIKDDSSSTGHDHHWEDRHSLGSDHCEAWQLTSLPVHYERNLTTVFEEKQNARIDKNSAMVMTNNGTSGQNLNGIDQRHSMQHAHQRQNLIRPPIHFDDTSDTTLTSENIKAHEQQQVSTGSMQSLNSCLTTTSAGVSHQSAPATPYRFSFAQPLKQPHDSSRYVDQVTSQKNIGLPPRVPNEHRMSINTSELTSSTRQDNSSSGNSSNCSSQINGMNNCDRLNLLDPVCADKHSLNSNEHSTSAHNTSATASHCNGYGNLNGLADSDADLTLLSETSTLQGDTGIAYYANKCSELERTVTTLKNKLIGKEKELTDLQLNQLNNDYTIERLKKIVGRLERENAQLKTIVASKS